MTQSPVETDRWPAPNGESEPAGALWRVQTRSHSRAVTSMVISGATLLIFVDIFAPFTFPFGITYAVLALRSAVVREDRRRAWRAVLFSCATVILWFLFIPTLYSAMNEGL
jgi:hypothetical protein